MRNKPATDTFEGEYTITTPKYELPKHIQIFSLNVKYNKKGEIVKIGNIKITNKKH